MGMGPVSAVRRSVAQDGLHMDDMDVIELNEAFAAQALAVQRELDLPMSKTNPNGSGIPSVIPLARQAQSHRESTARIAADRRPVCAGLHVHRRRSGHRRHLRIHQLKYRKEGQHGNRSTARTDDISSERPLEGKVALITGALSRHRARHRVWNLPLAAPRSPSTTATATAAAEEASDARFNRQGGECELFQERHLRPRCRRAPW